MIGKKVIVVFIGIYTHNISDTLPLETSKFASKTDFGYYPYIIDSASSVEVSSGDLLESGYDFKEIELKLDEFYKADRYKKKRIYEASGNHPFVAGKLQGDVPFSGIHNFQKQLIPLWQLLPAASYEGLKKIDLAITRECQIWQQMDVDKKNDYKFVWRIFIGLVFWIVFSIATGFFLPKNPIVFLMVIGFSFYLPFRIFK